MLVEDQLFEEAPPGPVVPMPEPVQIPESLEKLGDPDATWIYRTGDGSAYGAIMRWEAQGSTRKKIRPVIWNGTEFVAQGFGSGRPLYNCEMLAASPMAPVLIVEGEKTCDAAAAYLPDGWVATTWSGGSSAVAQTDWKALKDRACVIWPDNDEAGTKAAKEIEEILSSFGVKVVSIPRSPAFPKGWDLADELPEQFSAPMVGKLLSREYKRALGMNVPGLEAVDFSSLQDDPDVNGDLAWRPLGYNHQTYYLMSERNLQVDAYEGGSLMTEKTCLQIYPNREYWAGLQQVTGKPDWLMSGVLIQESCRKAGIYNPKRLRGRGVWMDKAGDGAERVVLNTGNQLLVKRPKEPAKKVSFVRFKSNWIYEKRDDLILDADDYQTAATDDDGRMIREMCQMVRWDSKVYADLLAGWLATAIVCGGLEWRTHCWITGNQGSGKTQVVKRIVGSVLGDLAIYPLGATTEAGIRSRLRSDAMPVVFDESETDKYAEQRRQAVLGLMRQASSDGRGTIMKGSANHTAHEFAVRSSFMLSSIGVGLKEAADLTRTAVLTVRPIESYAPTEREKLEENWNRLLDLEAMMPLDMPQRLLARQVANMQALRENIKSFKEAATIVLSSPRIGDQLGTLLAGSWSLYNTGIISVEKCKKYIEKLDLEDFTSVRTEREDVALLHHICGSLVRVDTSHGVHERAMGELLHIAFTRPDDSEINWRDAENTLARYGLRLQFDGLRPEGVWIGQKVPTLNRLMQTSDYFEGWAGVLLRHPHAKRSDTGMRFGGVVSRAIYIPRPEWPVHEA